MRVINSKLVHCIFAAQSVTDYDMKNFTTGSAAGQSLLIHPSNLLLFCKRFCGVQAFLVLFPLFPFVVLDVYFVSLVWEFYAGFKIMSYLKYIYWFPIYMLYSLFIHSSSTYDMAFNFQLYTFPSIVETIHPCMHTEYIFFN